MKMYKTKQILCPYTSGRASQSAPPEREENASGRKGEREKVGYMYIVHTHVL